MMIIKQKPKTPADWWIIIGSCCLIGVVAIALGAYCLMFSSQTETGSGIITVQQVDYTTGQVTFIDNGIAGNYTENGPSKVVTMPPEHAALLEEDNRYYIVVDKTGSYYKLVSTTHWQ